MKYSRHDLATIEDVIRVMFETPDLYSKEWYLRVRDVALEAGVKFRVTGNRSVNVKKSNRPRKSVDGTIRRLNNWFRTISGESMGEILPRADALFGVDRNAAPERYASMQVTDESWSVGTWFGQRWLPYVWESDKEFLKVQRALDGKPEEEQESQFSPARGFTYAGAGLEIVESPFVPDGEAYLMANGSRVVVPRRNGHSDHLSAHRLAAAINARPEVDVEAHEQGQAVILSTPRGRLAMAEHLLEHSLLYGSGAARIIWSQAERPIGQRYESAVVLPVREAATSERHQPCACVHSTAAPRRASRPLIPSESR